MLSYLIIRFVSNRYQQLLHNPIATNNSQKLYSVTITRSLLRFLQKLLGKL